MRVSRVDSYTASVPSAEEINASIERIAEQRRVPVSELIRSASSAGADAPAYLIRVQNLVRKLERIEQ